MTAIKGNLEVLLERKGPLIIRPNDHVATGGEGSVYKIGGTVIKIYSDPRKMQSDGMSDKIKLLSTLKHPYIASPLGIIKDKKTNNPIGFYMPFVEGEPLSRVFTNDFRTREGFTNKDTNILASRMREVVEYAHAGSALLVDANELNWLVKLESGNPQPRIIDVDSWAISRWPPKVIMPSIRDYHAKDFNRLTDWFSWGVVTFQLYTGIHPYKGKLDGFKIGELAERMKANASVFSTGIRLPQTVRDFSTIPGSLYNWYEATFQQGERTIPPSPLDTIAKAAKAAVIIRATSTASGNLIHEKIFSANGDNIIKMFPCGALLLQSGALIDISSNRSLGTLSPKGEVVLTSIGWLKADFDDKNIKFSYVGTTFQECVLNCSAKGRGIFRFENRLFLITDRGIAEVHLKVLGEAILALGQEWQVLVNSTKWFDGVGIQDAMGATYLITPFNNNAVTLVRTRELDNLSPIVAKAGNRFVTVIALDKQGDYHKFEFTMGKDYSCYTAWEGKTDIPELNIAILPKGVCATIVNDKELIILVPSNKAIKTIQDKNITTQLQLSNWEDRVIYNKGNEVWTVRTT